MRVRNQYRPQFEQLEQRAVPAVVTLHLTGTHALDTMVTGMFVPPDSATFSVASGLLKGTARLAGGTVSQSGSLITFTNATLMLTTKHGTVFTVNNGSADESALTFSDSGTIIGGTKEFKGATGSFTVKGNFVPPNTVNATLTGTISGPAKHHGHHHK